MPRPYSVVFSDFTNIQGTVTWNLPQYLSGLSLAMLHFFHNNYLSWVYFHTIAQVMEVHLLHFNFIYMGVRDIKLHLHWYLTFTLFIIINWTNKLNP